MILRAEGVSAAAQKSLHRQYNTDFSTSEYFWGNFHGAAFLAADEISLGQVGWVDSGSDRRKKNELWGNPGACFQGSVKTVCVDNVDNGEENFPGIVIINLFWGEMSKSIVF